MWRLLALFLLLSGPAAAVEPDEMLADPALEARAQRLDQAIRCVRCRSEAIASSNSDWARDARVVLRERIAAGESDDEVLAFFVARYGEYVLMEPTRSGANLLLWAAGPAMGAGGLVAGALYVRRRARRSAATERPLSEAERARLADLLED